MADLTPMLRQYLEIKQRHQDAILFYRLGDFYEMFFEDAQVASPILGIALTSRNPRDEHPVPLCGVPYHSVGPYLAKMLEAGHKVAICEQMEDPKTAKGVVKRAVVRVLTPGLLPDPELLGETGNNYLVAATKQEGVLGLAYLDLSTGEFCMTEETSDFDLTAALARLAPKELLLAATDPTWIDSIKLQFPQVPIRLLNGTEFSPTRGDELIRSHFSVVSLAGFGIDRPSVGLGSAGAVLNYVRQTQLKIPAHIRPPVIIRHQNHLLLDEGSLDGLEIFTSSSGESGPTLLKTLDQTVTRAGHRLLRQWLAAPLVDRTEIAHRQEAVDEMKQRLNLRATIRELLKGMTDIERIAGRVALQTATVRDLVQLRLGLESLVPIKNILGECASVLIHGIAEKLGGLTDLAAAISATYDDEGSIRLGCHPAHDQLASGIAAARGNIAGLELRERERTGIASLKVRYNGVFGFYIEVTKSHLAKVPADYRRRQTTSGGERFTTDELKSYEDIVESGDAELAHVEQELFQKISATVHGRLGEIAGEAGRVAVLDVIANFSEVAARFNYVRPEMVDAPVLEITEGRHPVLERSGSERFVPNDMALGNDHGSLFIITGPNMAGKSTLLRQTALLVVMAQTGCFIPATQARIGICDRIFTRVGASDRLAKGLSTFMVEMLETALILHESTSRSLLILDELGRGTSTYDGLAIAWAVAEHIDDKIGARTLFATHYHELTELARHRPRVRNFQIAVKEWGGKIIFLRRLVEGGASRSYGIQVARLAGLPEPVLERAHELLLELEKRGASQ